VMLSKPGALKEQKLLNNNKMKKVTKKKKKKKKNEKVCTICDKIGPLVCCGRCDFAFHPNCYLIENVPEEGSYFCRACSSSSLSSVSKSLSNQQEDLKTEPLDMCFFEALCFFRSIEEICEGQIPRLASDGEAMMSALSSPEIDENKTLLRNLHVTLLRLCKESGITQRNTHLWTNFVRRRLSRDERTSHDLESLFFLCGGTSQEWDDLLEVLKDTSTDYFSLNFHTLSFALLHFCHTVISVQKKVKKHVTRELGALKPIGKDRLNRFVYFVEVGRGQFWLVREALQMTKESPSDLLQRRVYKTFPFGGVGGVVNAFDGEKYTIHFDDDGDDVKLNESELTRILVSTQPRNLELVCRDEESLHIYTSSLEFSNQKDEIRLWSYLKREGTFFFFFFETEHFFLPFLIQLFLGSKMQSI
jgi:hypothetical protein